MLGLLGIGHLVNSSSAPTYIPSESFSSQSVSLFSECARACRAPALRVQPAREVFVGGGRIDEGGDEIVGHVALMLLVGSMDRCQPCRLWGDVMRSMNMTWAGERPVTA